jgi:sugar O-acyltransferase (sialic acid O-acetyltransferase NeuD family)
MNPPIAPISIPVLADESAYWLSALHVQEGQAVQAGELLARVEGQAASAVFAEIASPVNGYVVGLHAAAGQMVHPRDVLCYICPQPSFTAARPLRALKGADRQAFEPTALIVFGGGGHGKVVIDLVRAAGHYRIAGVIDDGLPPGSDVLGAPVLGGAADLEEWRDRGVRLAVNAVGGIGNVQARLRIFDLLEAAGFSFPVLVHPSAVVERSAVLEAGAQVFALAYVGSAAHIGFGSVINTGAIVHHDCVIGRVVNLSPGAKLAGAVRVDNYAQIGMGATVNLQVMVGERALLGNGCTVKKDVPPGGRVFAGTIWPPRA